MHIVIHVNISENILLDNKGVEFIHRSWGQQTDRISTGRMGRPRFHHFQPLSISRPVHIYIAIQACFLIAFLFCTYSTLNCVFRTLIQTNPSPQLHNTHNITLSAHWTPTKIICLFLCEGYFFFFFCVDFYLCHFDFVFHSIVQYIFVCAFSIC